MVFASLLDFFRVRNAERHGLFQMNVLARAGGGDRDFLVDGVRRGDDDGISLRVGHHLVDRRKILPAVFADKLLAGSGRAGEAAGHLHFPGGEGGVGQHGAPPAEPDEGHADFWCITHLLLLACEICVHSTAGKAG